MNILYDKLEYLWANPKERTIPRSLFFLMALDILLTLKKDHPKIDPLLKKIVEYYNQKVYASASELSYLAYVIDKYITNNASLGEKIKSTLLNIVSEIINQIEDMQNNGLWEDSLVKSCYVIIDLSLLKNKRPKRETIKQAKQTIKKLIESGEWKKLEKDFPPELKQYNRAKEIYLYSLIIRAVSKATLDFKLFSIKLAHSFIEDVDKILYTQRLKSRAIVFISLSIFSWIVLLSFLFLELSILRIFTIFTGTVSMVASIITVVEWMRKKQ